MNRPGGISRAELLYALAFLGAHIAFMPLFVLLLPRRVEMLMPGDAAAMLSWLLLLGGIVASIAHLASGAWSDRWFARHGNRRGLVAIGTAALVLSYAGLAFSGTPASLLVAVVAFQVALNLMFAPLGALLADHIGDDRKGLVAGMLNAALPLSLGLVGLLAWAFPEDGQAGFLATGGIAVIAVLPLLVSWPFAGLARQRTPPEAEPRQRERPSPRRDIVLIWLARLLVQLGAGLVLAYFYLYLEKLSAVLGTPAQGSITLLLGRLTLFAGIASLLAALGSGLLSDRAGRRKMPLIAAAVLAAPALALLALAPSWQAVAVGYILFNAALAAFLAIDTALVAQMVAGNPRRGAVLGLMNLTNTLPAILTPLFALFAISLAGDAAAYGALLWLASAGALAAAACVAMVTSAR